MCRGTIHGSICDGSHILVGSFHEVSIQAEEHAGGERLHRGRLHGVDRHIGTGTADQDAAIGAGIPIGIANQGTQIHHAAGGHHQRRVGCEMGAGTAEIGAAVGNGGAAAAMVAAAVPAVAPSAPIAGTAAAVPPFIAGAGAAASAAVYGAAGAGIEGIILVVLGIGSAAAAVGKGAGNAIQRAETAAIGAAGTAGAAGAIGTIVVRACHRKFLLSSGKNLSRWVHCHCMRKEGEGAAIHAAGQNATADTLLCRRRILHILL